MTWYASQASGTVIDYSEWNAMVSSIMHKGSEYRSLVMPYGISAQYISGQVLSMHSSRDINIWNSSYWNNSSLTWDSSINKWKALKSGGGTGTANSGDFKASTATWAWVSSQKISSGSYIGQIHYPIDFIFYREGENYYYKNAKNGRILTTGTDASTVLNASLRPYSNTYIPSGVYNISSTIYMKNYSSFYGGGPSTIFKFAQGVYDGFYISGKRSSTLYHKTRNVNIGNFSVRLPSRVTDTKWYSGNVFNYYSQTSINSWTEAASIYNCLLEKVNIYTGDHTGYHAYGLQSGATGVKYGATGNRSSIAFTMCRDMDIAGVGRGIYLYTCTGNLTNNAWMNSLFFKDIVIDCPIIGVEFDNNLTRPSLHGHSTRSSIMGNYVFDTVQIQCHDSTRDGFKNISDDGHCFHSCYVYDWLSTYPGFTYSIFSGSTHINFINPDPNLTSTSHNYYNSGNGTSFIGGDRTIVEDFWIKPKKGETAVIYMSSSVYRHSIGSNSSKWFYIQDDVAGHSVFTLRDSLPIHSIYVTPYGGKPAVCINYSGQNTYGSPTLKGHALRDYQLSVSGMMWAHGHWGNYISSTKLSGGVILTGDFTALGDTISGLRQPTFNSGAANKRYVDIISGNLDAKIDAMTSFNPINYITSTNSIARFADSSNIKTRFKSSSNRWIFASSQRISGGIIIGGLNHSYDYGVFRNGNIYNVIDGKNNSILKSYDGGNLACSALRFANKGNCHILVGNGVYTIRNNLNLSGNTWIQGLGVGITKIHTSGGWIGTKDRSNIILSDFSISGLYALKIHADTVNISGITCRNINSYVKSGGSTNGSYGGFLLWTDLGLINDGTKFINCTADHCGLHGFYNSCDNTNDGLCKNLLFDGCKAIHCGWQGTWSTGIDWSEKCSVKDLLITNCYVSGSKESGFHCEASTFKNNVLIENCISNYNGQKTIPEYGAGFCVAENVHINNCISVGNRVNGILLTSGGRITNCFIDGTGANGYSIYTERGIKQEGNKSNNKLIIKDNRIENISGSAIKLYNASGGLIDGNYIYNTITPETEVDEHHGIADSASDSSVGYIKVTNNIIKNVGGMGIKLRNDHSFISNNYIENTGADGMRFYGNSVVVGNTIIKTTDNAMDVLGNSTRIYDNYISSTSGFAIDINTKTGCVVQNNIINGSTIGAVGSNCVITNNTINTKNYISSQAISGSVGRFSSFVGPILSTIANSSNYSTHKSTYSSFTTSGHIKSIDYRNISANAKLGQNTSTSGVKYTLSYSWFNTSSSKLTQISSNLRLRFPGSTNAISRYKQSSGVWMFVSSQFISGGIIKSDRINVIGTSAIPGYLSSNHISSNRIYGYIISCNTFRGPSIAGPAGPAGTLSGPMAGNIGSKFIWGISGLSYMSSQKISGGSIVTDDFTLNANTISGLRDPMYPSAAANKHYIDTISSNLDIRIDAIGAGTLSGKIIGDIGGDDEKYGISSLRHISSQMITLRGDNTTDAVPFRDAQLKFREVSTDLWGFTIINSGTATNSTDRDLVLKRHSNSVEGTKLVKIKRSTSNIYLLGTLSSQVISSNAIKIGGTGPKITSILDEDDMVSDSATALATQQSIKAYIDAVGGGGGAGGYPSGPRNSIQYKSGAIGGHGGNHQLTYSPKNNLFALTGNMNLNGAIYRGGWSGSQIKSSYITDYIASTNVKTKYRASSASASNSWKYVSSQAISGQWKLPIYRTNKPPAGVNYEGRMILSSGGNLQKTWVWVCVHNDANGYEWIQIGISS